MIYIYIYYHYKANAINLPFGDGFYHPNMVILRMVCYRYILVIYRYPDSTLPLYKYSTIDNLPR